MKIQLFVPCFIDQIYPETAFNVVKVLEKLGIEVEYNPEQTCCGQPSFNSGYWNETKALAKKFLNDFKGSDYIVGASASCIAFIRKHYHNLLDRSEEANEIGNRIYEFSDFLVNILRVENTGAKFNNKVTFHDACSALREYGLKDEPRKLLKNVKGLELIEMKNRDVCCGFGGTFSVKHKHISSAMTEQKVINAIDSGAEFITSTEASCLMNIKGYISKNNLPLKTIHIADILASEI